MADNANTPNFTNVVDLGNEWLVKVYVTGTMLRSLVGRTITGIAPHPNGNGRMVPTYDVEHDGWLDKWFAFIVPKAVNADGSPKVHDLSARYPDGDSVKIESTQVLVSKDAESGEFTLRKLGYGEMIEHFGGERLTRGKDGQLVAAKGTTASI